MPHLFRVTKYFYRLIFVFSLAALLSCSYRPFPFNFIFDDEEAAQPVEVISGNPSPGSLDIYASADLRRLCVDAALCEPEYDKISEDFMATADADSCAFDDYPNLSSAFEVHYQPDGVNGLDLLLSREDLFFLAWVSLRHQINPHFLLGVMAQESFGNCAAVSSSAAEGCFQITNTFGQAQLNQSYPERVESWHWSSRIGSYYPDDIFVEEQSYFGELPDTEQFRLTLDPTAAEINGVEVSSVANFHFGIIAAGLYFHWQQYLLFHRYEVLREEAVALFKQANGKANWQAAAYNGGAFGAAAALATAGKQFLGEMREETQAYAPLVAEYCQAFQSGAGSYQASYTREEVFWLIELLAQTYESDLVDWTAVKEDVDQVFFSGETSTLNLIDDVKALIYVISTHLPALAPEWPVEESI